MTGVKAMHMCNAIDSIGKIRFSPGAVKYGITSESDLSFDPL